MAEQLAAELHDDVCDPMLWMGFDRRDLKLRVNVGSIFKRREPLRCDAVDIIGTGWLRLI